MTALSRLWSRAQLWRAAFLLALTTTVLAALYPPRLPQGPAPIAAHYTPAPPPPPAIAPPMPAPPASSMAANAPAGLKADAPAFGSTVAGIVPLAGERVPLPAGSWVTVASIGGRASNGKAVNTAILAQIAGSQATAIVVLGGLGLPDAPGNGFPRVTGCQETRNVYNRVFVARDNGDQACWSVDAVALPWDDASSRLRSSAAAELRQRGVTLPAVVLRSRFLKANGNHLLAIEIYQPADVLAEGPGGWDWSHIMATPERLAHMTRLRDWAGAWWPLLAKGFANQLQPADVTPSVAQLPS